MQVSKILSLLLICTIYSSCSTYPESVDMQAASNGEQQVLSFGRELDIARGKHVDILSPHHYKASNDFFIKAQKEMNKGSTDLKTLRFIEHNLTSAKTYLHLAEEAAKKSFGNVEDILLARQMAVNSGSAVYFQASFARADNVLRKMASGADPKLDTVMSRASLKNIYAKLEVESLSQKHLDDARKNLSMAIKEGAKTIAPLSLSSAIREYQRSANHIRMHPRDVEQIGSLSQAANQSAYLVLQMTRESVAKRSSSTDEVSTRQSAVKNRK